MFRFAFHWITFPGGTEGCIAAATRDKLGLRRERETDAEDEEKGEKKEEKGIREDADRFHGGGRKSLVKVESATLKAVPRGYEARKPR